MTPTSPRSTTVRPCTWPSCCRAACARSIGVAMIRFFSNGHEYLVDEVGTLRLSMVPRETLSAGEVGYVVAGVKNIADAKVTK